LGEFHRPALEALRQPLEDGFVAISRVQGQCVFPARIRFVGTMNLCPCGARGDPAVECSCSPQRLASYREKLSRALLDRFDLVVVVPRARSRELGSPGEPSDRVRARVERAAGGEPPPLERVAGELLDRAVDTLPLSARGRAKVGRVAATIASLAGEERIAPEHVAEALSYRPPAELAAWS
jgi:magnesium chelatase family protein